MQISENIQNNNYANNISLKSNATSVSNSQAKSTVAVQVASTPKEKTEKVTKNEELAKVINELSVRKDVGVNFHKDETTGQNIVQFIDNSTREVIKQFPSEEMLKVIQQIDKFLENHSKSASVGDLLNEVA
jgi:flagellar protein FlaG